MTALPKLPISHIRIVGNMYLVYGETSLYTFKQVQFRYIVSAARVFVLIFSDVYRKMSNLTFDIYIHTYRSIYLY